MQGHSAVLFNQSILIFGGYFVGQILSCSELVLAHYNQSNHHLRRFCRIKAIIHTGHNHHSPCWVPKVPERFWEVIVQWKSHGAEGIDSMILAFGASRRSTLASQFQKGVTGSRVCPCKLPDATQKDHNTFLWSDVYYIYIYIYIHVYMYTYVYNCTYIHIDIHTYYVFTWSPLYHCVEIEAFAWVCFKLWTPNPYQNGVFEWKPRGNFDDPSACVWSRKIAG